MPSDMPPRKIELDLLDDGLDARIYRLEELFDSLATRHGLALPALESTAPGRAAVQRLAIFSTRLQAVMTEAERRIGVGEADAADALTARLLMDELKGALRECRLMATDAGGRLDRADEALRDAGRLLARETASAAELEVFAKQLTDSRATALEDAAREAATPTAAHHLPGRPTIESE